MEDDNKDLQEMMEEINKFVGTFNFVRPTKKDMQDTIVKLQTTRAFTVDPVELEHLTARINALESLLRIEEEL